MAISGDLKTMSLPDLLQWASLNRKSGLFELERRKIRRQITFREGRIVGCSSEDPATLLGQSLLARGKITQNELGQALARQQETGGFLGEVLIEMQLSTDEEIRQHLEANGQEILFGMFDWTDAVFRFDEDGSPDPNALTVDFGVEDILLEGVHRRDEMQRVRQLFPDSSVVLERTEKEPPKVVQGNAMAKRVLAAVDGQRTLGEILLHAHASEYKVMKLLYLLQRHQVVSVVEAAPALEPAEAPAFDTIDRANWLAARGEYGEALDTLNACLDAHPSDSYLRQRVAKAERAYLRHSRDLGLTAEAIPVRLETVEAEQHELGSNESFILGMVNGKTDVKTMQWIAPLRESQVLIALQRMREKGIIAVRELPASRPEEEVAETV